MNRATTCINNNDGNGELWTSDESSNSHRFLFCFGKKGLNVLIPLYRSAYVKLEHVC